MGPSCDVRELKLQIPGSHPPPPLRRNALPHPTTWLKYHAITYIGMYFELHFSWAVGHESRPLIQVIPYIDRAYLVTYASHFSDS